MNHPPLQDQPTWRPAKEIAPEADAHLREILKRCSPCTYYATRQFRATGDRERLPTILLGIIERYVPAELRAKLKHANDALRLHEDLGIDSLSLMEIGLLAEDVLQIVITDEEMQHLHTLGDIRRLMDRRVGGL